MMTDRRVSGIIDKEAKSPSRTCNGGSAGGGGNHGWRRLTDAGEVRGLRLLHPFRMDRGWRVFISVQFSDPDLPFRTVTTRRPNNGHRHNLRFSPLRDNDRSSDG